MHLVPMGQVPDQSQPRRQRLVIGVRAVEEDSGHLAHILCSLFAHGSYQSQLANRFTAILGAEQMLWRNAVLNAAFAYDQPLPQAATSTAVLTRDAFIVYLALSRRQRHVAFIRRDDDRPRIVVSLMEEHAVPTIHTSKRSHDIGYRC